MCQSQQKFGISLIKIPDFAGMDAKRRACGQIGDGNPGLMLFQKADYLVFGEEEGATS